MPKDFDPTFTRKASQETPLDDEKLWMLLSVYLDGEANPEETAQVEELIRSSPAYSRELERMRYTAAVAQSLPEMETPDTLCAAIFAATTLRPTPARRIAASLQKFRVACSPTPVRLTLAGGALAAAALALIFVSAGHRTPTPRSTLAVGPRYPVTQLRAVNPNQPVGPVSGPSVAVVRSPQNQDRNQDRRQDTHRDIAAVIPTRTIKHPVYKSFQSFSIPTRATDAAKHLALNTASHPRKSHSQRPNMFEQPHNEMQDVVFSPQPMMDKTVEKYRNGEDGATLREVVNIDPSNSTDTMPTSARSDGMPVTSASSTVSATLASQGNANGEASPTATHVVLRVPPLSQMPPHFDIQHEIAARSLGFSSMAREAIKHREVSIALIGGKF